MKKSYLFLVIFLLLLGSSFSQNVLNEQVLEQSGSIYDVLKKSSLLDELNSSGTANGTIEFCDVKGGFVVKYFNKKFMLQYYDDELKKKWEAGIKMKSGVLPKMLDQSVMASLNNRSVFSKNVKSVIGNGKSVFFLQSDPLKGNFLLSRVSKVNGSVDEANVAVDGGFDRYVSFYCDEEAVYILAYKIIPEMKKLNFTLISISTTSFEVTQTLVRTQEDGFERVKFFSSPKNTKLHPEFIWNELCVADGRIVLYKRYYKKHKENKDVIDYIIKTVEIKKNGKAVKARTFAVNNIAANCSPKGHCSWHSNSMEILLDRQNKRLYFMGAKSFENKEFIDGIYIYKFDYESSALLIEKSYRTKELSAEIHPAQKMHSYIDKSSISIDIDKQYLVYGMFNSWDKSGKMMEMMYVDTMCNIFKVTEVSVPYRKNEAHFTMLPYKKKEVYKNKSNPLYSAMKKTPIDYIYSFMEKKNPDNVIFGSIQGKKEYYVISLTENDGELKAYKIK